MATNLELSGAYKRTEEGNELYYYGGGNPAWANLAAAYAGIPSAVREGKTFGVYEGGEIVEYWWKDGTNIADTDEVAKGGSGSGITAVVEDTSPQLGGDLDVNDFLIKSSSENAILVLQAESGEMAVIRNSGDDIADIGLGGTIYSDVDDIFTVGLYSKSPTRQQYFIVRPEGIRVTPNTPPTDGWLLGHSDTEGLVYIDPSTFGGGGGGIASVTGDSVDNTDPTNPIVNAIPLSGTTEGNPVTGDIEMSAGKTLKARNANDDGFNQLLLNDSEASVIFVSNTLENRITLLANGLVISTTDLVGFNGVVEGEDFSPFYTDLSHVNKGYVDSKVPVIGSTDLTTDGVSSFFDITHGLDFIPTLVTLQATNSDAASQVVLLGVWTDHISSDTFRINFSAPPNGSPQFGWVAYR